MQHSANVRAVGRFLVASCLLPATLAQRANAQGTTTLTFGPVPTTAGGSVLPTPYVTGGYTFGCINANGGTACNSLTIPGTGLGAAFTGTAALLNNNIFGITTLAQVNGTPFDLLSVTLSPFNALQSSVTFEGFLAGGGAVQHAFVLATAPGTLETYAFADFVGLSSLQYRVGGFGPLGVDNAVQASEFVVSPTTTAPEPSSTALLASGLVALVPLARRRTREPRAEGKRDRGAGHRSDRNGK